MKTLRKNSSYKFPDGITRKIIDVEKQKGNKTFTNSDYACYYVDIPFKTEDNGKSFEDDDYFEKYSDLYEDVLYINFGIHTPPTKYIKPLEKKCIEYNLNCIKTAFTNDEN